MKTDKARKRNLTRLSEPDISCYKTPPRNLQDGVRQSRRTADEVDACPSDFVLAGELISRCAKDETAGSYDTRLSTAARKIRQHVRRELNSPEER